MTFHTFNVILWALILGFTLGYALARFQGVL